MSWESWIGSADLTTSSLHEAVASARVRDSGTERGTTSLPAHGCRRLF